jgi:hypothetical protein
MGQTNRKNMRERQEEGLLSSIIEETVGVERSEKGKIRG